MDEKMIGYMLNMGLAVDKCMSATETFKAAFLKQLKINKKQMFTNVVLTVMVAACVNRINSLIKVVRAQDSRIKALEPRTEENEKKGE